MILMQQQILSSVLHEPNIFIGGVGGTSITSASDLASKTTLSVSDISNFTVDINNNISFFTNIDFILYGTLNDSNITYVIDKDLRCDLGGSWRNNSNLKIIHNKGLVNEANQFHSDFKLDYLNYTDISLSNNNFYSWRGKYIRLINVSAIPNSCFFQGSTSVSRLLRVYIPSCDNVNANAFYRYHKIGATYYINNTLNTQNGGLLNAELQRQVDERAAIIVVITDFTAPNAVSDLSASNITSSGCDLDFTTPSSTNTLDFYEVWIENIDLDEWHVNRVVGRYSINQEITASGDTITGLASGTNYKIWIVACDEFWNRSEKSNVIEITTL